MRTYDFPNEIKKYTKGMQISKDHIGRSQATIYNFKNQHSELYLKVEQRNIQFEQEQKVLVSDFG